VRWLLATYSPLIVRNLVYMLQATEYNIGSYLSWFHRTRDFSKVIRRKSLVYTQKAMLLVFIGIAVYLTTIIIAILIALKGGLAVLISAALIIVLPVIIAYLLVIPLVVGQYAIQKPKERRMLEAAQARLRKQHCRKIAIAGSYGKTTFKETLATILSETLHVAASPGNMNTPIGLANFIQKLDGSEDVLIFEFGEERVGDVKRLCELTHPNMGVITGISEAHLSSFKTMEAVTSTVLELREYLKSYDVYKNGENEFITAVIPASDHHLYSEEGVNGWKVSKIATSIEGTSFVATKHNKTIWAHTSLIGRHQVGPLVACIDIADKLGLSVTDIAEGIKKTKPFEHRMQPYTLLGATIIDDTYNGNLKGVAAGIDVLKSAKANRKIYVTPGLVEQGELKEVNHVKIGHMIADSDIDEVVLMNNSVTQYIAQGMKENGYQGHTRIVDEPLEFYTNLSHYVASGDVVLLQNDWSDNYA